MSAPIFPPHEAKARNVFLALMWAMSYPGRAYGLPGSESKFPYNFISIGNALLDLETSFHTSDPNLVSALAQTTAANGPDDKADYHFHPTLTTEALFNIEKASIGTMLYPDRSATLVLGATIGRGTPLRLTGPGVNGDCEIRVDAPDALWEMRSATRRYPLGWDIFLVDGGQVVGLPRSSEIERID